MESNKNCLRSTLSYLVLVLLTSLCVGAAAHAQQRTFTGTAVYGAIADDGTEVMRPTNYLLQNAPVQHVTVRLKSGLSWQSDPVVTDASGRFSLTIDGEPANLRLFTWAENDAARVMTFNMPALLRTVVETDVDFSTFVDYGTCPEGSVCEVGSVTVVDDSIDTFVSNWATQINLKSRAFYIASAAEQSRLEINSLLGALNAPLVTEQVDVRYGYANALTAFYLRGGDSFWADLLEFVLPFGTIFITTDDPVIFFHEYGHFLEEKLTAFGNVPSYLQHQQCTMITDPDPNPLDAIPPTPNLCWAWFEGVAQWFGTIDSVCDVRQLRAAAAGAPDLRGGPVCVPAGRQCPRTTSSGLSADR